MATYKEMVLAANDYEQEQRDLVDSETAALIAALPAPTELGLFTPSVLIMRKCPDQILKVEPHDPKDSNSGTDHLWLEINHPSDISQGIVLSIEWVEDRWHAETINAYRGMGWSGIHDFGYFRDDSQFVDTVVAWISRK
jgi:hypothetical protein